MTARQLVWIEDLSGAQIGVLSQGLTSLVTDLRLDSGETLELAVAGDHPKAYMLQPDYSLRFRGRRYRIKEPTRERSGTEILKSVEAHADWYQLGELDYIGELTIDEQGPAKGGLEILADSGWTVDPRTVTEGLFSMRQSNQSLLALCRTWAKITGTYLEFDTLAHTVAWLATRGVNRGVAFRVGRNTTGVRIREAAPTVTQLWPFGRDNLSIEGVAGEPYVEDFTYYTDQGLTIDEARERFTKRKVWRDVSFITDTDLHAASLTRLALLSQPVEQVDLSVVDISSITGLSEPVEVGDIVIAQDPDLGGEWSTIVTRVRRDWLQPARDRIELSASPSIVADPNDTTGRDGTIIEWHQFLGPISANFEVRNDATWTIARIPLRFGASGQMHSSLDLTLTGVGAGTATVTVVDDTTDEILRSISVAYTDGAAAIVRASFGIDDLTDTHDLRLRVTTVASGGPSPTNGVNIAIEETVASWWVMARDVVRETPAAADTSVVYSYTGAVQSFTVPDNVEEIVIECKGAAGGAPGGGGEGEGGGQVSARLAVTPGTEYDVYVGGMGAGHPSGVGGWPNGGDAGPALAGTSGGGGGGASYVTPDGASIASAIIVAAGGAGTCESGGGIGGFFAGGTAADTEEALGGGGATQTAGGSPGGGDTGGQGNGGDGGSGGVLNNSGGGGGGGFHGGGGGGTSFSGAAGGGGGSGYAPEDAVDLLISDGSNTLAHGQVTISWAAVDA